MYIKSIEINKVRSIDKFKMEFEQYPGWHVLIGDNGSGKSTIIRSIALALMEESDVYALSLLEDFIKWLHPDEKKAEISLSIIRDNNYDKPVYNATENMTADVNMTIHRNGSEKVRINAKVTENALWGENDFSGWFAAAYGPFRRLRGDAEKFSHLYASRPRLGACLTAFRDDAALTQLASWLKDLKLDAGKKKKEKEKLDGIINFINSSKLLPFGATLLNDIDSDGIKLRDANGVDISLDEMSDGYRSVLSMTLDIIRFLIETYGIDKVFPNSNQSTIDLPGVILIDEVDVHLHPTWQTEIGQWFTKYFPQIQFIVATHTPLICRACENGSIWKLPNPNSSEAVREIKGNDKKRLIYGNVLDAYSTDIFGQNTSRSEESVKLSRELAMLSLRSFKGIITEDEKERVLELQKILPTQR